MQDVTNLETPSSGFSRSGQGRSKSEHCLIIENQPQKEREKREISSNPTKKKLQQYQFSYWNVGMFHEFQYDSKDIVRTSIQIHEFLPPNLQLAS